MLVLQLPRANGFGMRGYSVARLQTLAVAVGTQHRRRAAMATA